MAHDLIINIYNFRVFGSIKKNKTSYFLLKKCEFGDYHELKTIEKISNNKKIILLDCGCNYGFYSLYAASLRKENLIISIEASKVTSLEFKRNLLLNKLPNITFLNKAVSNIDGINITFNESENDWESSNVHKNFKSFTTTSVESVKIDTVLRSFDYSNYSCFIKLDIEGNEMKAIEGGLEFIKKASPIIIIEFSRYIFDKKENIQFLENFLSKYDYSIYNTNNKKINIDDVMTQIKNLKERYKTIGNFYLIKNFSNELKKFLTDE